MAKNSSPLTNYRNSLRPVKNATRLLTVFRAVCHSNHIGYCADFEIYFHNHKFLNYSNTSWEITFIHLPSNSNRSNREFSFSLSH